MSSSPFTIRLRTIVLSGLFITMAGCGHEAVRRVPESGSEVPANSTVTPPRKRSRGETAVVVATRLVGVPYRYGGSSRQGFDCSGLVQYAWAQAGVRIPRTTSQQWQHMSRVHSSHLRKGDLLFFRIDGRVTHVGMYVGGGRFVHAPSTGRTVSVASLASGFYQEAFVGATRP